MRTLDPPLLVKMSLGYILFPVVHSVNQNSILLFPMDITKQYLYVTSKIKQIRTTKGISQEALSEKANISQSFLANLENGKKQASVLTILRIAQALEVNPGELFPKEIAFPVFPSIQCAHAP